MIAWVGPFGQWYGTAKSIYLLGHYHAPDAMLGCLGTWDFFEQLFQKSGKRSNVDGVGLGCQ
jgi:hypothetical protein